MGVTTPKSIKVAKISVPRSGYQPRLLATGGRDFTEIFEKANIVTIKAFKVATFVKKFLYRSVLREI